LVPVKAKLPDGKILASGVLDSEIASLRRFSQ
jgi:hypothetical protein